MVLSTILKLIPVISRYAKNAHRFSTGETTFVSRFPPAYRPYVKDVIKGFATVSTGGVISDILQADYNGQVQKKVPRQSDKFKKGYSPGRSNYRSSGNGRVRYSRYNKYNARDRCYKRRY